MTWHVLVSLDFHGVPADDGRRDKFDDEFASLGWEKKGSPSTTWVAAFPDVGDKAAAVKSEAQTHLGHCMSKANITEYTVLIQVGTEPALEVISPRTKALRELADPEIPLSKRRRD